MIKSSLKPTFLVGIKIQGSLRRGHGEGIWEAQAALPGSDRGERSTAQHGSLTAIH